MKFWAFIKRWWKKQVAVAVFSSAVIGFVSAFNIIPEKQGIIYLIAVIILSIVVAIVWTKVDIKFNNETGRDISSRLGSFKSLDEKYKDNSHYFTYILRQDLLDYSTQSAKGKDFVSFRVLEGKNVSKKPTESITYLECTEYKTMCQNIEIKAFDLKTQKELRVEFINRNEKAKYYDFPFKIYFSSPLLPNEEFEIAFFIKLNNELDVLRDDDEIMSISLSRYKRGVEELEFNVCLNFEPSSVQVEYLKNKKLYLHNTKAKVKEYVPQTDLENTFTIQWSETPYIIKWKCKKPKCDLYAINYRK